MPARTSVVWARSMVRGLARLDAADGIEQADMGSHVDHAQVRRHQHHRHLVDAGQVRQHLRVAGEDVAAGMQRFLVERRGADGIESPAEVSSTVRAM